MDCNCQNSPTGDGDQGEDDGDDDVELQVVETFTSYQMASSKCQAVVTVRQLRSRGLSFQLWPAANALCWYVEHEFGEEGMRTHDCSVILNNDAVVGFSPIVNMGLGLPDSLHAQIKPAEMSPSYAVKEVTRLESDFPNLTWRRMRVLELGAGTGLVGIGAACLGAHVVITDLAHVIPNITFNVELNKAAIQAGGGSVEIQVLRWGVADDVGVLGHLAFDVILASDCVYHVDSFKPLLDTLKWVMSNSRAMAALSRMPTSETCEKVCIDKIPPDSQRDIQNESKSRLNSWDRREPRSTECVILLGHLRRWKKDTNFFRMASKLFDIDVAHRHPPEENTRIGSIVYLLSTKSYRNSSSGLSLPASRLM